MCPRVQGQAGSQRGWSPEATVGGHSIGCQERAGGPGSVQQETRLDLSSRKMLGTMWRMGTLST